MWTGGLPSALCSSAAHINSDLGINFELAANSSDFPPIPCNTWGQKYWPWPSWWSVTGGRMMMVTRMSSWSGGGEGGGCRLIGRPYKGCTNSPAHPFLLHWHSGQKHHHCPRSSLTCRLPLLFLPSSLVFFWNLELRTMITFSFAQKYGMRWPRPLMSGQQIMVLVLVHVLVLVLVLVLVSRVGKCGALVKWGETGSGCSGSSR